MKYFFILFVLSISTNAQGFETNNSECRYSNKGILLPGYENEECLLLKSDCEKNLNCSKLLNNPYNKSQKIDLDIDGIYSCQISSSDKNKKLDIYQGNRKIGKIQSDESMMYPLKIEIYNGVATVDYPKELIPEINTSSSFKGMASSNSDYIYVSYKVNGGNKSTATLDRFTGAISIKSEILGGFGNLVNALSGEDEVYKTGFCEKNIKRKF